MSEQQSQQTRADGSTDQDRPSFPVESLSVLARGQLTIPHRYRLAYDLDRGDYVDFELTTNGEETYISDAKIGESGRITIPARTRDRHTIEPGDRVDIVVFVE